MALFRGVMGWAGVALIVSFNRSPSTSIAVCMLLLAVLCFIAREFAK